MIPDNTLSLSDLAFKVVTVLAVVITAIRYLPYGDFLDFDHTLFSIKILITNALYLLMLFYLIRDLFHSASGTQKRYLYTALAFMTLPTVMVFSLSIEAIAFFGDFGLPQTFYDLSNALNDNVFFWLLGWQYPLLPLAALYFTRRENIYAMAPGVITFILIVLFAALEIFTHLNVMYISWLECVPLVFLAYHLRPGVRGVIGTDTLFMPRADETTDMADSQTPPESEETSPTGDDTALPDIDPATQDPFFSGRVSRRAYWFFSFTWGFYAAVILTIGKINDTNFFPIIALVLTIANISMTTRRLHDVGKSGWYQLVALVPVLGAVLLLWELLTPGDAKPNRFGRPQPHEVSSQYVLLTYVIFFLLISSTLLMIGDNADATGRYAATLVGILTASFLLTLIYNAAFKLPGLQLLVRVKGYLALAFAGLTLLGTLSVFVGDNEYDVIDSVLTMNLYLILITLGLFLFSRVEAGIVSGDRQSRASLAGILATVLLLLTFEHISESSFYYLRETPREELSALEKISLQKYLWILSIAEHDAGYMDLFTDALYEKNRYLAEFMLSHGCDANHDDVTRYMREFIRDKEWTWAELLLSHGADLNRPDERGDTHLNALVYDDRIDEEQARWLAANGAKADDTTAQYALSYADESTIRTVMGHFPEFGAAYRKADALLHPETDSSDETAETPVSPEAVIAAQKGLKEKGLYDSQINALFDRSLQEVLADAILEKEQAKVQAIMQRQDLNLTDITPGTWSALMSAAEVGDLETARQLLALGADVNHRGEADRTALARAIFSSHPDMVALLVKHGASLTVEGPSIGVPLILAEEKPEIIRILLDAGADPNVKNSYRGETVLHTAAMHGAVDTAKMMLKAHADVNTRNRWDDTPLLTAVERNHSDIVALLIANGADLEAAKPYDGSTPLLNAVKSSRHSIIHMLVQAGANVNAADKYGNTPLSLAQDPDTLSLLRESGAQAASADTKSIIGNYEKAYDSGDIAMPYLIGELYDTRLNDHQHALEWYRKAYEHGDIRVKPKRMAELCELAGLTDEAKKWQQIATAR